MNTLHIRLIELKQWLTGQRRRVRRQRLARQRQMEALCAEADAPRIGGGPGPVVSLTTYGRRLGFVHCAIESIVRQSLPPQRVILWLTDQDRPEANPALMRQAERGLEIRRCEDLKSFKKLIPTLRLLGLENRPPIVTIDDDAIYAPNLLERLQATAERHPGCVITPRPELLSLTEAGDQWTAVTDCPAPRPDIIATGVAGVYYPAGCFTDEVLRTDRIAALAPKADDLWFWAMERLAGTLVMKSPTDSPINEDYVDIDQGTYQHGLALDNVYHGGNNRQLSALLAAYPQISESIKQWLQTNISTT